MDNQGLKAVVLYQLFKDIALCGQAIPDNMPQFIK